MRQHRILLIEDEPKVAASIKNWLEEQQFIVEIAPDGAVGRHLALSQGYDLVLLDLNLPYVDGYEVCRSIRERFDQIPIIILTALGSIEKKTDRLRSRRRRLPGQTLRLAGIAGSYPRPTETHFPGTGPIRRRSAENSGSGGKYRL